jgi:hypothetical protein
MNANRNPLIRAYSTVAHLPEQIHLISYILPIQFIYQSRTSDMARDQEGFGDSDRERGRFHSRYTGVQGHGIQFLEPRYRGFRFADFLRSRSVHS